MKIVKLELSESARRELLNLQNNGSGLMRERSLAILHCANGQKITWIANALNRRILTIRTWIERYRKDGIHGLERSYSPGCPSGRNTVLRPKVEEYLSRSPRTYGWYEDCWTMPLLKEQLKKDTEKTVGISTLERLLKDCGYSYKRPRKGVPATAPSKEEKLARVQEIAAEILKLKKDSDVYVFFVDESHFSTEPYVVRGWYRRGEDFFPRDKSQQEVHHNFWRIQTADKIFLLEECRKSDSQTFKAFLHQLIGHCSNSKTILVLDNASIHTCRYIKEFIKRNPNLKVFTLPAYSPEYNPTEQVWRWLKPRVCSLPKAIRGGCEEIISRIRKVIGAWTFGKLAVNPKIGIGIWQNLLFNYL